MGFTTWMRKQLKKPTCPEYQPLAEQLLKDRAYPKGVRERLIIRSFMQAVGYRTTDLETFDRMWRTYEKETTGQ